MRRYICREKLGNRIRVKVISKEGKKRVGVKHIGVAHSEKELAMFLALARETLMDKKQQEFKFKEFEEKPQGELIHKKSYSKYLYDEISKVYEKTGVGELEDEIFKKITIARIIEPASKLDTVRILEGLGLEYPSESGIWHCLKRAIRKNYRKKMSEKFVRFRGIKRASILLYDVTTLYFETEKEDGYRRSGFSKERRLEPQIIVGLLVDKTGFPLSINSFEGNKAETTTIIPVLHKFKEENKIKDITVVADAGMLSESNLRLLEEEGFKFIVGSRISKTPYEIEEYIRGEKEELEDGQIFEIRQKLNKMSEARRVVYQYKYDRAKKDLRTIEKQVAKAQKEIEHSEYSRTRKFIKITEIEKEIDEEKIKEARLKAGIKGYVTNLECEAQIVIDGYHNLFQVEKSFRMTKSDLQARPIFHHTRDSIEAHLTVCFAALAICRYIQDKTGLSIKKFKNRLEPLRTAVIEIAGQEHIAQPAIDIETQKIVKLLQ